MAGIAVANVVQLGDSATATQNLVIRTNVDGTFTLARGNVGATTQDILTIDANGRIAIPQTVVCFNAYQTTLQSVPNASTIAAVNYQTIDFDIGSYYNTSTMRYTPQVPGYYWFCGNVAFGSSNITNMIVALMKNGGGTTKQVLVPSGWVQQVTGILYMNGSTDYVQVGIYQASGSAQNTGTGSTQTFFSGYLIGKA